LIWPPSHSPLSSLWVFFGGARPCQPVEEAEPSACMENSSENTASPSRNMRSRSRRTLPSLLPALCSCFSLPPHGLRDLRLLFLGFFQAGPNASAGLGAAFGRFTGSGAGGGAGGRLFPGPTPTGWLEGAP
jgi:hypothetical protein